MLFSRFFLGALVASFTSANVLADCFEFRPDSLQPWEFLRGVKETERRDIGPIFLNEALYDHSEFQWTPANGYLTITVGADFPPKILIIPPGGTRVHAESWDLEPQNGYHYAEVHISGRRVMQMNASLENGRAVVKPGDENLARIIFTSKANFERGGALPTGGMNGWIHVLEHDRFSSDTCNSNFVPSQGGGVCDMNCPPAAQPYKQPCPLGLPRRPDGTCYESG